MRKLEIESHAPICCNTQIPTQMMTTAFRIILMVASIGIKRLIAHKAIPTMMSAKTRFTSGTYLVPSLYELQLARHWQDYCLQHAGSKERWLPVVT